MRSVKKTNQINYTVHAQQRPYHHECGDRGHLWDTPSTPPLLLRCPVLPKHPTSARPSSHSTIQFMACAISMTSSHSSGHHPWKSIPKWSPTRQCHRTSPERTQKIVWTTMLIAAYFSLGRDDCTSEDRVTSSLPLLPIEMWHAILGSYRAYELALR